MLISSTFAPEAERSYIIATRIYYDQVKRGFSQNADIYYVASSCGLWQGRRDWVVAHLLLGAALQLAISKLLAARLGDCQITGRETTNYTAATRIKYLCSCCLTLGIWFCENYGYSRGHCGAFGRPYDV